MLNYRVVHIIWAWGELELHLRLFFQVEEKKMCKTANGPEGLIQTGMHNINFNTLAQTQQRVWVDWNRKKWITLNASEAQNKNVKKSFNCNSEDSETDEKARRCNAEQICLQVDKKIMRLLKRWTVFVGSPRRSENQLSFTPDLHPDTLFTFFFDTNFTAGQQNLMGIWEE